MTLSFNLVLWARSRTVGRGCVRQALRAPAGPEVFPSDEHAAP